MFSGEGGIKLCNPAPPPASNSQFPATHKSAGNNCFERSAILFSQDLRYSKITAKGCCKYVNLCVDGSRICRSRGSGWEEVHCLCHLCGLPWILMLIAPYSTVASTRLLVLGVKWQRGNACRTIMERVVSWWEMAFHLWELITDNQSVITLNNCIRKW